MWRKADMTYSCNLQETPFILSDVNFKQRLIIARKSGTAEWITTSWQGEVFSISAFNKMGTEELCAQLMDFIEALPAEEEESVEEKAVEFKWDTYHQDAMSEHDEDDDDDWDDYDDDYWDENVVYTKE